MGVGGYAVFSLACAFAPTAPALVVLRFAQGLLGGVAVVIARAVVRDREEGAAAARVFSLLMLVSGIAPIAAPLFGGLLINVTSWRGIFVGAVTARSGRLARCHRHPARDARVGEIATRAVSAQTLAVTKRVVRHRPLMGYALTAAFSSGALFFYISSSSFVFQDIYGLTVDAVQPGLRRERRRVDGGRLAERHPRAAARPRGPAPLGCRAGSRRDRSRCVPCCGSDLGLPAVLPALMFTVLSLPFIVPNATALALNPYGREAGTVSALIGVLQFAVGAVASPLASVAGEVTAFSMAFGMAIMAVLALITREILVPT